MNVVYDLLGFQSRDHGERGIARYVLHLALALERVRPGLITQYLMHPHLPFPAGAEPLVATGRVVRADRWSPQRTPTAGGVFIAGSPFETFNLPSELILPSYARSPWWRSAVVVHDVIPALFPELYLTDPDNASYYSARLHSLNLADRFLTNSEATSDDTIEMLGLDPANVTMIGAGADARFRRPAAGHRAAGESLVSDQVIPGLEPDYILFPTGIDPRKNIERTIEAYGLLPASMRRRHQLVLACRLSDSDRVLVGELATEAGLTETEFVVTGYTSDETLCRLYQGAHLVVFPSYYEGFGLPALEAMHCGAPVLCADAASLKEVQPIDAARFDPMDPAAIAEAIQRGVTDSDFRDALRQQAVPPFTWELAAERAAVVIDELVEIVAQRRVGPDGQAPKPRLALFAPLPSLPTSSARYTYRMAEALSAHVDVTVFVGAAPSSLDAPDGVTVAPASRFEAMVAGGAAFDRVLVITDNDRRDIPGLQALLAHGGCLLLHTANLTAVYNAMFNEEPDSLPALSVGELVATTYPGRYRPEVEELSTIPPETSERFGVALLADAARRADAVFTHWPQLATLAELDTGMPVEVVSNYPCPPGPADRPDAPATSKTSQDGPPRVIVTAFGEVRSPTDVEGLLVAWSHLVPTIERGMLRLVGSIDGPTTTAVLDQAEGLGIGDRIDVIGHVSDREVARLAGESTLVLHLGRFGRDKVAYEISELIAAGSPTLVSTVGPGGDLPDDAVVKLPPLATTDELTALLGELLGDDDRRRRLSRAAVHYANDNSYEVVAKALVSALFRSNVNRG